MTLIFSENVLLNDFQTSFRVKVDVTRRYDDANQVIWYWPEQILVQKAYTESIKAKLHKHDTIFLIQKMGSATTTYC